MEFINEHWPYFIAAIPALAAHYAAYIGTPKAKAIATLINIIAGNYGKAKNQDIEHPVKKGRLP